MAQNEEGEQRDAKSWTVGESPLSYEFPALLRVDLKISSAFFVAEKIAGMLKYFIVQETIFFERFVKRTCQPPFFLHKFTFYGRF